MMQQIQRNPIVLGKCEMAALMAVMSLPYPAIGYSLGDGVMVEPPVHDSTLGGHGRMVAIHVPCAGAWSIEEVLMMAPEKQDGAVVTYFVYMQTVSDYLHGDTLWNVVRVDRRGRGKIETLPAEISRGQSGEYKIKFKLKQKAA